MIRRVRPWAALRRVLLAPGLVLLIWLGQLAFAKLLASPGRAAATAAMKGWVWFDDGHLLRALVELIADHPAVPAAMVASLLTGTILAALFSTLIAPALLARLDGERASTWLLTTSVRELPAVVVQTLYGSLFRAACLGLAAIPVGLLGLSALPLAVLIGAFPVLVLDRARAAVVLDDARRFHPMTFLRAIVHVARRPLWWLLGAALEGLKLGVAVGIVLLVIAAGPSPLAIWVARAASLIALLAGLWRVSLAVEDRRGSHLTVDDTPTPPAPADAS